MRTWLLAFVISCALVGCSEGVPEPAAAQEQAAHAGVAAKIACAETTRDAGGSFAEEETVIDDIGTPCLSDDQCSAGKCVTSMTLPGSTSPLRFEGGYCTVWCPDDRRCGREAACPLYPVATFLPDVSVCLQRCSAASDCRAGYVCGAAPPLPGEGPSTDTFCVPPSGASSLRR